VPGAEIAVRYLPGTRDAEVGGDFWDVAVMPAGEVALAVGDVAGHDITAAATMAQLRSAYRALRVHTSGPGHLIELVQGVWGSLDLHRMATSVFARLKPASGALCIASAGHPPPVVIEDGTARLADVTPTTPFGAPPRPAITWRHTLRPGGTVVLYTDGLVEDRDRPVGDGIGGLVAAARSGAHLAPERLADHLLTSLASEDRADDIALLILRRVAGRWPI
jgi:serine/threonine-protein kinase RsbW